MMDRLTDAGQEARNHMAAHAEAEQQEPPGDEPEDRRVFVYVRLEPVEYRLEAASAIEGLAVLEDKGGAVADRRLVPVGVADESGVPFAFVLDEGVA